MKNMPFQKLKRRIPWYIISVLLTILGSISIVLLFISYFVIHNNTFFWCLLISWITILIVSTIEISILERHRKKAEDELEKQLHDKKRLLKEVYHRMKNHMQMIYSMLKLQKEYTEDELTRMALDASKDRVKSITLAHRKMSDEEEYIHIDFSAYVKNLINQLLNTQQVNEDRIAVKMNIKFALMNINYAIPCGLIINELVSNSMKFAFPGEQKGEINVSLQTDEENNYILSVSDNGIGFPGDIDFRNPGTFGLQLVNILVDQLNSIVELDREGGTSVKITFKKRD